MLGKIFTAGLRNVKICSKPGWAMGGVPAEIIEAVFRVAAALWNHKDEVGYSQIALESSQISKQLAAVLDRTTRDLVAPYRRPRI